MSNPLPIVVLSALLPLAALAAAPAASRPAPAGKVDFVKQVKPLLEAHCAKCHGMRPTKAYSLLTKKQAFTPGESDDAPIVPGKADQSLIVQLVKGSDPEHRMPQKAPALKPEQIALLEKWINEGAAWPDGVDLTPPPEKKEK